MNQRTGGGVTEWLETGHSALQQHQLRPFHPTYRCVSCDDHPKPITPIFRMVQARYWLRALSTHNAERLVLYAAGLDDGDHRTLIDSHFIQRQLVAIAFLMTNDGLLNV